MLKEAIEKLLSLAPANVIEDGARKYTDRAVTALQPPNPNDVDVTTLGGFLDLIHAKLENFDEAEVLAHVVNYRQVALIGRTSDEWGRRKQYIAAAVPETRGFQFGQFLDHESFVIGVQANFTEVGDREYLLKLASNLTNEKVSTSTDDGISQQVAIRAGVTLKTTELVKSRVSLAPYRTFREVQQPASEFVFRVKQSGDSIPTLALFEADGGRWQIEAIEAVARYLRAAITKIPVIA